MRLCFSSQIQVMLLFWVMFSSACLAETNLSVSKNTMLEAQDETRVNTVQLETRQYPIDNKEARVRALQKRMLEEGYYSGPVNGIITPETRRAARNEMKDRD